MREMDSLGTLTYYAGKEGWISYLLWAEVFGSGAALQDVITVGREAEDES